MVRFHTTGEAKSFVYDCLVPYDDTSMETSLKVSILCYYVCYSYCY